MRRRVVLPAPFGPSRPVMPEPMFSVMSLTATTFPNHLDTESNETMASGFARVAISVWVCIELTLRVVKTPCCDDRSRGQQDNPNDRDENVEFEISVVGSEEHGRNYGRVEVDQIYESHQVFN